MKQYIVSLEMFANDWRKETKGGKTKFTGRYKELNTCWLSIMLLVGVIMGYSMYFRTYPGNDFCRSCLDEGEEDYIYIYWTFPNEVSTSEEKTMLICKMKQDKTLRSPKKPHELNVYLVELEKEFFIIFSLLSEIEARNSNKRNRIYKLENVL